jgi:UDP-glucose 4-epimerase
MSNAPGFKVKKVVVVGGSGFLGGHVADALSLAGYEVTIFDLVAYPSLREDQTMILGSLLDRDAVFAAIDGADVVYHFAGIADIGESKLRPRDTLEFNIMGTVNLLDASVKSNVSRFVFASTMYVYNDLGSFYGASKQSTEVIIGTYCKEYDLQFTLLRYGSLYGPRAQSWNGVRKYIEQIIESGSIEYIGSGSERREYIHVYDAAKLSVDILAAEYENVAITVTGHQVLTSKELMQMIFEICNLPMNVEWVDPTSKTNDHYSITPYKYNPVPASKIVPRQYIDLGQGIKDVIEEVHRDLSG